jgi:iron complex outermembrane receptor protein
MDTLAQAESTKSSFVLDEIVVTAQRRAQNLDSVGATITAYSGDTLEDLGFSSVGDVALMTPGVSLSETGVTGVPVYTIRGVGFDDYSSNSTSTVGVYVDEVSLPYPVMTRGPQFDIERVEILKGPQGTLYGRNSTGGAVNLISRRPTEEFEAGATLDYGRFQTMDTTAYISGSLTDKMQARLSATNIQSGEGWQRSSSRDDTLGEQDKWAVRGFLEWDISDSISLTLKANGYQDESENPAPQYFTYIPLVPDLAEFYPPPEPSTQPDLRDSRSADWSADFTPERDNNGQGLSSSLNWTFNNGMTLTSISSYEAFERKESNDWDGSSIENLDVFYDTDIEVYSQEIRLASDNSAALNWIVGAYFAHDELDESWIARGSESTIFLGVFGAVDTRYNQESDSAALFSQAEWQWSEQWRVTGGLRYTEEAQDWKGCSYDVDGGLSYLFSQLNYGPIPGFADQYYLSSSTLQAGDCVIVDPSTASFTVDPDTGISTAYSGTSAIFEDSLKDDNLSGKLGLDWTPTDNLLVYASYSTGFKSGGYNGASYSSWSQLEPYKAEKLTAYELGVKTTFIDDRMRLNGALFSYDYKDKQNIGQVADDVFGLLTQIVNVEDSAVWGADAELEWQATQDLYFRISGAWLETEVKKHSAIDTVGVPTDFEGESLAQTPKWQFSGMAEYRTDITEHLYIRAGADFSYSDEYQSALSSPDTADLLYVESYTVFNGRVGIGSNDDRWELMLWAKNLSDEYYYTSANISDDYWFRTPGRPLTWGLRLNVNY